MTSPTWLLHDELNAAADAMRREQDELAHLTRGQLELKRNDRVVCHTLTGNTETWLDGASGVLTHLTFSPSGNGAYVLLDKFPQDPQWFTLAELRAESVDEFNRRVSAEERQMEYRQDKTRTR